MPSRYLRLARILLAADPSRRQFLKTTGGFVLTPQISKLLSTPGAHIPSALTPALPPGLQDFVKMMGNTAGGFAAEAFCNWEFSIEPVTIEESEGTFWDPKPLDNALPAGTTLPAIKLRDYEEGHSSGSTSWYTVEDGVLKLIKTGEMSSHITPRFDGLTLEEFKDKFELMGLRFLRYSLPDNMVPFMKGKTFSQALDFVNNHMQKLGISHKTVTKAGFEWVKGKVDPSYSRFVRKYQKMLDVERKKIDDLKVKEWNEARF
jgi:hypothetical protein